MNSMASINTEVANILGSCVTELYEGSLLWTLIRGKEVQIIVVSQSSQMISYILQGD